MEFVVPALAVGGMILASQDERSKEATRQRAVESEKNVATQPLPNYPNSTPVTATNDVNYYSNPNAATDRYFQQEVAIENAQGLSGQYMLLSGEKTNASEFMHNNMQPFFGSSVKQPTTMPRGNESALDNMTGAGSQYIKKTERAPLFKPKPSANWTHGAPSSTDFIQSRQVAGMSKNNTKPFESVQVAPGLGEGFSASGSGGFNAGQQSRELWRDKTVDELRAANNPKCTFPGVTLGGQHFAPKRGIEAPVQKNNPDRHYAVGPERYMTTTGAYEKPTGRPTQDLPQQARTETTREAYGVGGHATGSLGEVRGRYRDARKAGKMLEGAVSRPGAAVSTGSGSAAAATADHGRSGFKASNTSRAITETRQSGLLGQAVAAVKALVVPFREQLAPTRKENVIGNARSLGVAGTSVASGATRSYVNELKTTKKQMQLGCRTPGGVASGQVHRPTVQSQHDIFTNRGESMNGYTPPGGATAISSLPRDHTSAYAGARGADKETTLTGRMNQGSTTLFNSNYAPARDVNMIDHSQHMLGVGAPIKEPPSKQTIGSQSHRLPLHSGTAERLYDGLSAQHASNPYAHSVTGFTT